MRNISKSQNYVPAVVAAEAKMTEMMARDVMEEDSTSVKTDDGYTIETAILETLKDRFQSLPVKIMEITVTVRWQMDQKEKTFVLKSFKTISRSGNPAEAEKKDDKKDEKANQEPSPEKK